MCYKTDEGLDIHYEQGDTEVLIANYENIVFLSLNDIENLYYLVHKEGVEEEI